jgi:acyl-CoA reductase-like NAD-dependent aldehyde dehydrogenase
VSVSTTPETLPMYIDGSFRRARSGETLDTINPATGEVIARFPRGDAQDIDDAVAAAEAAFHDWRAIPATERARMVRDLADRVEEHAEELALLDVKENGSPIREMRADAYVGAAALRYFAGLALELRGETIPSDFDRLDYTVPSPFGVVGRIIPFNHPFMFAASKSAAPLIAGNTVILKPSEHTSMSTIRLAELADGILPKGVFNVVTGMGQEAGDALVVHPKVRRLAFTGSAEIGRSIQQRAATHVVKSVSLELGGKNPLVVMPDADLDVAVEGAIRGMNFTWQGQSCGSTSRLIVQEARRDELVERLAARMDALQPGSPEDEATDTGAIVHRGQYDKVLTYLKIGRDEGSRVVAGGGPPQDDNLSGGMFLRPTLFTDVKVDSRLAQEEIFGPVLAVITYDTYEDAIRIANGIHYGLTASIFTGDLRTAHRFARDVQAGYVWVNDSSRHFPGVPFGGFKDSGVGREESLDELVSYTQIKNVNINFG